MFQTLHEISKNLIFVFVWKYVWKYVNINVKKKKNMKENYVKIAPIACMLDKSPLQSLESRDKL